MANDNSNAILPTPDAAPAAFSLPQAIRSSGFSWTEILAFLSLAEVVKCLSLLRNDDLSPVGFFPTAHHKTAMLKVALRDKVRWYYDLASPGWHVHSLTTKQEVTPDDMRTFVAMLKVVPMEVKAGDPARRYTELASDDRTCIIKGVHSSLQVEVKSAKCPGKLVGTPPLVEFTPCGTVVFEECFACNAPRNECRICGPNECPDCQINVCLKCIVPDGGGFCKRCGFTCDKCNQQKRSSTDGKNSCNGPNVGVRCPNGIVLRCDDCMDGKESEYCRDCDRWLCSDCGTFDGCDHCSALWCTACRSFYRCPACDYCECTKCLETSGRRTCDRCDSAYCHGGFYDLKGYSKTCAVSQTVL